MKDLWNEIQLKGPQRQRLRQEEKKGNYDKQLSAVVTSGFCYEH